VRLASSRLIEWLQLLLMADDHKLAEWNRVGEVPAKDPNDTKDRTLRKLKNMGWNWLVSQSLILLAR
jgi:hypothetical protein